MKPERLLAGSGPMEILPTWTKPGTSIMEYVALETYLLGMFIKYTHLQVFRKVEKQLPQLTTLDLQYVSPSLLKARNLDLAVPGMSLSCQSPLLVLKKISRNLPVRSPRD